MMRSRTKDNNAEEENNLSIAKDNDAEEKNFCGGVLATMTINVALVASNYVAKVRKIYV